MLKIQNKLFYRSTMRTILSVLWFIGCITYHIYYIVHWGVDDLVTWGADGVLFMQLRSFFFYFVIMAFLSFDYFREVPNANYAETIQITGRSFRSDCGFAVVMSQFVLLSAIITIAFSIYYFYVPSTLTRQTVVYSLKVSGLYIGMGGILAILLGWFLARRMNKLIGYVVLLLFCICISTPMVQNIKLLLWGNDSLLSKCLRVFYFLPEVEIPNDGTVMVYGGNLYPIQFSQVSRILFWILLLGVGIISCYSFRLKKGMMFVLFCAGIGSMWFVVQPTNAWCTTSSFDVTDSSGYVLDYYEDKDVYCKETETDYQISHYKMQITPGWVMHATVELHFTGGKAKNYDMTLYHLYKIDSVTDLEGNLLTYGRDRDYLTIHAETEALDGVIITYHGGNSCFYCNRNDIFLPAWFPYYPIVGFHNIYNKSENEFVNNTLEEKAEFDITFLSEQDIYSDLQEVEKNHFVGSATGAMFLSGLFESKTLENGITCVYCYLDPSNNPELSENREIINDIARYMTDSGIWKNTKEKMVMLASNISGYEILYMTENAIAGSDSWYSLMKLYEKTNNGEKVESEITPAGRFVDWYTIVKESGYITYEDAKDYYDEVFEMEETENSEEAFESFFIEQFGKKEWSSLKGE